MFTHIGTGDPDLSFYLTNFQRFLILQLWWSWAGLVCSCTAVEAKKEMEPRNNPGINISCRSHKYFRSKYTNLTCFASLCCFISAVVVRGILVEDDLDAVLPHLAGLLLVFKVAGLVAHSPPVARVVAQQRVRRGVVRVVRGRVSSSWRRRFRACTSTVHPLLLLLFQARPNRLPCLFDVDLGHLEQVDLSQVPTGRPPSRPRGSPARARRPPRPQAQAGDQGQKGRARGSSRPSLPWNAWLAPCKRPPSDLPSSSSQTFPQGKCFHWPAGQLTLSRSRPAFRRPHF